MLGRSSLRRLTLLAAIGGLLTAGASLAAARVLIVDLPPADQLLSSAAGDSSRIYDRNGVLLFEVPDPRAGRRTRVPLARIAPAFIDAVVAVEDARFYSHPGLDARALLRAGLQAVRERRIVSGGSTITQQLARLVLLSEEERRERTLSRKLRESILAVRLERAYSKDQILEMYANEVYFGDMAYGVEAAARAYFDTTAAALSVAESAMLAGLIQAPALHSPRVDYEAARKRQQVVLDRMVSVGSLTEEQAQHAREEPLQLSSASGPMRAPHYVSYVLAQLEDSLGEEAVHSGSLQVTTSLDYGLQRLAEDTVSRHVARLSRQWPDQPDANVTNGALVALDPMSGDILAMVGSADYFAEEIAGAVNVALARRQPGSSIKPVTYAAAFDVDRWGFTNQGEGEVLCVEGRCRPELPFTAATILSDVPTAFPTDEGTPYRPANYDRQFHGPMSLRRALATSSNVVAVRVLDAIGVDAMLDTARALGITSLEGKRELGLGLTLGAGEVTPLELTAAYAVLARQGKRVTPVSIISIEGSPAAAAIDDRAIGRSESTEGDRNSTGAGSAVAATEPYPAEQVLSPQVAYLLCDILSDDRARMPAFGEGSVLSLTRPAAVKTGTTTDFHDNWTVGFTPELVVGVWVGIADNTPMTHVSGVTGAAPIWHDFMEDALRGKPATPFARPEGLVELEICVASGLLATDACSAVAKEWFVSGTEPVSPDTSTHRLAIDASTGLLWHEGCEGPRVTRTFVDPPADALFWLRLQGSSEAPTRSCLPAVADHTPYPAGPHGSTGLVITHPPDGSVYALAEDMPEELQTIAVRLYQRDIDGPIRLISRGELVAELATPPWQTQVAIDVGPHTLIAEAVTSEGVVVRSEPVRITVLAPTSDLALAAAGNTER